MSIIQAASSKSVLEAALAYLELGISVLPCKGKAPALAKWTSLQVNLVPYSHVHEWHRRGLLQNVGVIGGTVSGNLVLIDLDGTAAVEHFGETFPDLMNTFMVTSGSRRGAHLYLYAEELPPTTRVSNTAFGGFELRANGSYVIAPPSMHPDTDKPYTIAQRKEIQRVAHLRHVVEWIRAFQLRARVAEKPAPAAHRPAAATPAALYLEAAIRGEVQRVITATEGNRNNALFWASVHLANLFSSGISRDQAEAELLAAARAVGTPEREARNTIRSGFNIGIKYPRPIPDRFRRA